MTEPDKMKKIILDKGKIGECVFRDVAGEADQLAKEVAEAEGEVEQNFIGKVEVVADDHRADTAARGTYQRRLKKR